MESGKSECLGPLSECYSFIITHFDVVKVVELEKIAWASSGRDQCGNFKGKSVGTLA